jgi:peptide/nickel transport system ATP-binding protein
VVPAVKDVSFSVEENEIVTIVGESGSGKSTMARMVLGLLPITSGTMTFRGRDVTHLKGRERTAYWREVQAVFQDPFSSFNQFFTVRRLLNRSPPRRRHRLRPRKRRLNVWSSRPTR